MRLQFLLRCSVFFLCVLASCSTYPPVDVGLDFGEALSQELFDKELSALQSYKMPVTSLRALSQTRIQRDDKAFGARHIVVFDREQAGFRQEMLAPNSAFALEVLIAKGDKALFLDTSRRKATELDSSTELFENLIGFPLTQQDLASLFLGDVFSLSKCVLKPGNCFTRGYMSGDAIVFVSQDETLRLQFNTQLSQIEALELIDPENDSNQLIIRYFEHRMNSKIRVPHRIRLAILKQNLLMDYRFSTLKLNSTVDPKFFETMIPLGYQN